MSSNEQFPTSRPIQSVQNDATQRHVAPDQAESASGSTDIASARLPTMVDLDSLAESLDQVDQTLAELDQAQVAS